MRKLWFIILMAHLGAGEYIDVVIPAIEKDCYTLNGAIDAARKHIFNIRRVIVVSPERYTDKAEWFDEKDFPFSITDIGNAIGIFGGIGEHHRRGWYYQQVLKFYAPFVIPDISNNVLILDADTLFLTDFRPLTEDHKTVFHVWPTGMIFDSYITHMKKTLPSLAHVRKDVNPVVNHMLFQKDKLEDLFHRVEEHHHKPFWQVFCNMIDTSVSLQARKSFMVGASEYTIYFYFMANYYPDLYEIRIPKMENKLPSLKLLDKYRKEGYDIVSCHHYYREPKDRKRDSQ